MSGLYFSKGNSKLSKDTLIFSLPAGSTCPGAKQCLSVATMGEDGKMTIKDGPLTKFRCYAASQEALYPSVYASRQRNLFLIKEALKHSIESCADLIINGILDYGSLRTTKVRIHESGDFFNEKYLNAWILVAEKMPQFKFYCYSKNLPIFVGKILPSNFYVTASYGGQYDHLISDHFPRYAKVYNFSHEVPEDMPIDWDDSHALGDRPFALLVHGVQPKGTDAAKGTRETQILKKSLKDQE